MHQRGDTAAGVAGVVRRAAGERVECDDKVGGGVRGRPAMQPKHSLVRALHLELGATPEPTHNTYHFIGNDRVHPRH